MSGDNTNTNTNTPASRDQVRAAIFSAKGQQRVIPFLGGTQIELRAPDLGSVLDARQAMMDNPKEASAQTLVRYTYVPGTNERVFEDTDVDSILALPFGPELKGAFDAINDILGIGSADQNKQRLDDHTKSPSE